MTDRRRGRRPRALGDTRQQILRAAQGTFAEHGLDGATLRAIAGRAGVDPALLLHYFGSKEALFVASIRDVVFERTHTVLEGAGPGRGAGARLVSAFLEFWDPPEHRAALVAIVRGGISNDRLGGQLREFFRREMPARIASYGLAGDLERRVGLVASQLIGLAVSRYVLRLPAVASARREELVAALGPTLDRYLVGRPARAVARAGTATPRRAGRGVRPPRGAC